jgi:hypothetical protein
MNHCRKWMQLLLVDEMSFKVEYNGLNRSVAIAVVNQRIRMMKMHRRQSSEV